jgi:predicted O-methyltransferase YrrM
MRTPVCCRFAIAVVLVAVMPLGRPPVVAAQELPPSAASVLKEIRAADKDQLAVSEEDGRFMRLVVLATRTKRALEIGTASGYSAIWIGLGLKETGGHLVTIEYDKQRAAEAVTNIKRAGLADVVSVIQGDALAEIPKISASFDFVFCDAWKRDYQKYFNLVFPALNKGGVFLAHNVVNKSSEMADFLKTIRTDPRVVSSIVSPGSEGMSISYKR